MGSIKPLCKDVDQHITKTNLQSLTFEECNIEAAALAVILRYPKALRRLTLGERLHKFRGRPALLCLAPKVFLDALFLQAESLEYLMMTGGDLHPSSGDIPWSFDESEAIRRLLIKLEAVDIASDSHFGSIVRSRFVTPEITLCCSLQSL